MLTELATCFILEAGHVRAGENANVNLNEVAHYHRTQTEQKDSTDTIAAENENRDLENMTSGRENTLPPEGHRLVSVHDHLLLRVSLAPLQFLQAMWTGLQKLMTENRRTVLRPPLLEKVATLIISHQLLTHHDAMDHPHNPLLRQLPTLLPAPL